LSEFDKLNAVVLGISPDSEASHVRFIEKQDLKVRLLSDSEHTAMEAYGVWQLKKMYGREFMGVVRSTFLIDPEGKVAEVWRNVSVKGHVEKVLEALKKSQ
jgi:peroxiredoxin Q/BCP